MDPHDRRVLEAYVRIFNLDTINDLLRGLVRRDIFDQGYVDQHKQEILDIIGECRLDAGTSSSDSDVDGRDDLALPTRRRAKMLKQYGPVDDCVSISIVRHNKKHATLPFPHSKHLGLIGSVPQVTAGNVSLFKPQSGTFGFATSRHSEGDVSFIQSRTVENNELELKDDGTVTIEYKQPRNAPHAFGDPDDQTARTTCCIVLSDLEAKILGMKVDIVFGIHSSKILSQQRYHLPAPPPCPTPWETEPSLIHQPRYNDTLSRPNRPRSSQYHPRPSTPEYSRSYPSLDRLERPRRHHHHSHRQDLYQDSGSVSSGESCGQPDWRSRSQSERRSPQSSTRRSSGRRKQQKHVRNRGLAGVGFRLGSIADEIIEWIRRHL